MTNEELLKIMAEAVPATACVVEGERKAVLMNLDELLEFSRTLLSLYASPGKAEAEQGK